MTENTNTEREATGPAEVWLRSRYGAYRGHFAWRELEEAFNAGRASLSLPAAGQEPVATDEWKVRGYLAKTLKCWHRLTDEEAAELVAMTLRLSGLYPTPQPAPPTEQQAYDMGAKGAPATEAERLLFEAWMRGHCWALCATWDGKSYRSDAEQGGNLDPRAMNTRQLWAAWRDRSALAAPQPATADAVDALTVDDALLLEKAVTDFEECGETDVPDADLRRFATMGLLECVHYNVLPAAQEAIDAALAAQRATHQGDHK